MVPVPGGVTAPSGFLAGAIFAGIKPGNKKKPDVALVCSDGHSVAAAVFTNNKIKAAPVRVSLAHLRAGDTRAVVLNSGNANACTGLPGIDHAKRMARAAAATLGLRERQVLVCSTGRIGMELPIEKIESALAGFQLPTQPEALFLDDATPASRSRGPMLAPTAAASKSAAKAIMTSDTFPKEFAVRWRPTSFRNQTGDGGEASPAEEAGRAARTEDTGPELTLGGIAKGAGMICPNMATMLCVLTTDARVEKKDLQRSLAVAVEQSFNRITIDGDMSTNDTVILLANGRAMRGRPLQPGSPEFESFQTALNVVTRNLARMIVEDGEGVTKFVEVHVSGAATFDDARKATEAIANSTLVKCAWNGNDPNWGRIIDAVGYSGAQVREEMIDIYYNGVIAVKNGVASQTPAEKLREVVSAPKFTVHVHLHLGDAEYMAYTTDLSTEYVRLNRGE
ncbi:MAG: bifunctional ornithine acetyltransferase/N-acetylglutamate synthase [Verrucomicrobia bacterium]|nr:bifunctional ornithine acetyltransferase/N-acetylglutamate synthase [Verrucomicrobiota bacterium]MBV9658337.1 bifunctional ornithine acetyltransferase/N-acetylglutamate synthase [Verrucomicrobiota bacterium]